MVHFSEIFRCSGFISGVDSAMTNLSLFMFSQIQTLVVDSRKEKKLFEIKRSKVIDNVKEIIQKKNETISIINNGLKDIPMLEGKRIKEIDHDKVIEILSNIGWSEKELDVAELTLEIENLEFKIEKIFDGPRESIKEIIKHVIRPPLKEIQIISPPYKSEVMEALDIFSIGYPCTAVFIIGKTLEHVIIDILSELIQQSKISLTEEKLKKMKFENKLNRLYGEGYLEEGDWHKIHSIKWDRNIAGHPSSKEEFEKALKDSKSNIQTGINKILLLQETLKKLKT